MGYIHPLVSEMRSAILDPICGKFDKFFAHGQAHMGQMGKWPWQCTTRGLYTIPQNFEWRKCVKRLQRYGVHKSGSRPPPARPDREDNTPPGWGVKFAEKWSEKKISWQQVKVSFLTSSMETSVIVVQQTADSSEFILPSHSTAADVYPSEASSDNTSSWECFYCTPGKCPTPKRSRLFFTMMNAMHCKSAIIGDK